MIKSTLKKQDLFSIIIAINISLLFCPYLFGKTIIRFATVAPEGSAWMDVMHSMNDDLKKRSGGDLSYKFYPNMVMGDEKDIIRKMRFGQIQAAGFTGFGLGEILPEIRILELPYLFQNDAEIDYISDELFDYFNSAFMEKGFILLGWGEVGWIYFLGNHAIAEPKDLENAKMWMWQGDPLAQAFFDELGKSPVPLSVTDVLLSLQTGLIDAVYGSPLAALALQWFTQVEYISDVPFTHSTGAVLMDKRTFDKLDPEQQVLLLDVSKKHLRNLVLRSRQENIESYKQILKEGIKQVPSTEEQRQTLRKIGLQVNQRLAGDLYSPELLERMRVLLIECRNKRQLSEDNSHEDH